jgi:D-arabinose 1-dehydrogenase-like Zn-dependent alcohol dehydrogenase
MEGYPTFGPNWFAPTKERTSGSSLLRAHRVVAAHGGKLELVNRPVEEPTAGMVRLAVEACGICHTDVLTVAGRFPGLTYPRVPGQEAVGSIDAFGAGVSRWKLGQRVGRDPSR